MCTLGIILAGGTSRRMKLPAGVNKASVPIAGYSLIHHVVQAIRPAVDRLVVVVSPEHPSPEISGIDEIVHDTTPHAGPLSAIADALQITGKDMKTCFVSSCDVPFLKTDIVHLLLNKLNDPKILWAVPWVSDHPQVLASALRVTILDEVKRYLATGRHDPRGLIDHLSATSSQSKHSVHLVKAAELVSVDPQLMSFNDIDTPNDLAQMTSRLLYSGVWRSNILKRNEGTNSGEDG